MKRKEPYKIKSILESLREDVIIGEITLEEAAIELHRAGWSNFVDEEKTKRLLGLDNKEEKDINEQEYRLTYDLQNNENMRIDECAKMVCYRAAEMWENPEIKDHVLKTIEKPITKEKIQEYMYNLAFYTLYMPVEERKTGCANTP